MCRKLDEDPNPASASFATSLPLPGLRASSNDKDSMIVDTLDGNETFGFESMAQRLNVFPVIDSKLYSGSTCVVRHGAVRAKHPR